MPAVAEEIYKKSQSGLFIIAGPCALESLDLALEVATALAGMSAELALPVIFKSSFDKANRTAVSGFRGPGLKKGLSWLLQIKEKTGLPVITDIHNPEQASPVSEVADIIQIPAFLCRQTDLLLAAGQTGCIVNVKKGQFLAPWDMKNVVEKIYHTGNRCIWLTERGTCFGYNNLVVDMRSIASMQKFSHPVVFDATHSVQLPGGQGPCSGGEREYVPLLAKAAVAAGVNGVFLETHPSPDTAKCDGPNSWPLKDMKPLLRQLKKIWCMHNAS